MYRRPLHLCGEGGNAQCNKGLSLMNETKVVNSKVIKRNWKKAL